MFNYQCGDPTCDCSLNQFDWASSVAIKLPSGMFIRGEYNGYGNVYCRVVNDGTDEKTIGSYSDTGKVVDVVNRPEIGTIVMPTSGRSFDFEDDRPEVEVYCFGVFSGVSENGEQSAGVDGTRFCVPEGTKVYAGIELKETWALQPKAKATSAGAGAGGKKSLKAKKAAKAKAKGKGKTTTPTPTDYSSQKVPDLLELCKVKGISKPPKRKADIIAVLVSLDNIGVKDDDDGNEEDEEDVDDPAYGLQIPAIVQRGQQRKMIENGRAVGLQGAHQIIGMRNFPSPMGWLPQFTAEKGQRGRVEGDSFMSSSFEDFNYPHMKDEEIPAKERNATLNPADCSVM